MDRELLDAADHLLTYGYCLLEDRLPQSEADSMADDFLRMHMNPEFDQYKSGSLPYETLFGMLNHDDRVWECAFNPDTLAIARHLLASAAALSRPAANRTGPVSRGSGRCTSTPPEILRTCPTCPG